MILSHYITLIDTKVATKLGFPTKVRTTIMRYLSFLSPLFEVIQRRIIYISVMNSEWVSEII